VSVISAPASSKHNFGDARGLLGAIGDDPAASDLLPAMLRLLDVYSTPGLHT
jgi:hypothetical protein